MQASDVVSGILAKKNEMGLTNQQLSDASGVPKSTVDRILRGDTPNPTLEVILPMARAVGYSFGEPSPELIPEKVDEDYLNYVIRTNDERIARLRAHYNMLIAEKDRALEAKDKWIRLLFKTLIITAIVFIAFVILMLLIMGLFFADAVIPHTGWIQS